MNNAATFCQSINLAHRIQLATKRHEFYLHKLNLQAIQEPQIVVSFVQYKCYAFAVFVHYIMHN